MSPSNVIKIVKKKRIKTLIQEMKKNIISLPGFQRDFVWKPEQMAKLIESVIRNYPIGTFMFLPYSNNKDLGLNSFVNTDPNRFTPEFYVIDGQQRLKTFLKLLDHPRKFKPESPIEWEGRNYKIFVKINTDPSRLTTEDISKPSFVIPQKVDKKEEDDYKSQGRERMMPLEFISSKRHIEKWFKLAFNNQTQKVNQYKRFALEIQKRISQYQCPVESVFMKLSPVDHTNIFRLLNEAGTDLTTFDLLSAQLHTDKIRLRNLWNEANETHKIFLDYNLDPIYILKILVLIRKTKNKVENPTCMKRDIKTIYGCYNDKKESNSADMFIDDWNTACKYTAKALESMRDDFGAVQKKYIPYSPMIVTLATLKWYISGYNEKYKSTIRKKINRWYWGSIFNKKYEKATDERVSKDYTALRKWASPAKGKKIPREINYRLNKEEIKKRINEIESSGDARYKAILCLPLVKGARDLYSDECLATSVLHDHHIYPKKCKETKDVDLSKLNIIINRMLITDKTNGEILKKSPYEYLDGVASSNLKKYFLFKEIVTSKLAYTPFIKLRKEKIVEYLYKLIN